MHANKSRPFSYSSLQGSALVATMILSIALLLIVASLLSTLLGDKRITQRYEYLAKARNASEGVAELVTAELDRRARSYSTLTATPLGGFTLSSSAKTILAGSHISPTSIEFKVGSLSPLPDQPTTLVTDDPFYASDSDAGKPVSIRHGYIYTKASSIDPITGQLITSYISTLVQIRSQSWLNFGIFGNLDLEFHSGSQMDVYGPVHSNANIYVTAGGTLNFYEQVTTTGSILRKYKYNSSVTHTADVKFARKANPTSADMLTMSRGTSPYEDSRRADFHSFADPRWKGFVQDHTFDVDKFNPPSLLDYREDDYSTTPANETLNSAYAMIEPQLSIVADIDNSSSDDTANNIYAGHKGENTENLKFSAVAGLTIRVKNMTATQWTNAQTDNDNAAFDPGFQLIYYTGSTSSSRPVNRDNLPVRDSTTGKPVEHVIDISIAHMKPTQRDRLFSAIKLIQFREATGGTAGNRRLTGTIFSDESTASDILSNTLTNSATASTPKNEWFGIYDRRQGYQYASAASTNNNDGLKGAYHLLHIDMGKLDAFLNADPAEWQDKDDSSIVLYNPAASYSGVIYVQFPLQPYSETAVFDRRSTDAIRPARAATATSAGYALLIRNARRLPQFVSNTNIRDDGLTLVTNGPAYILGHYNADGSSGTGSEKAPDSSWDEIPALIGADAVTLLSSDYTANGDCDADDNDNDCEMRYSALTPLRAADFTEVSAAITAGIIPTRLNTLGNGVSNQWMGGVHNYVRFLEDWTDDIFRYRGSMMLLFENEVSRGPWYQTYYAYWYKFPERNVGYHTYFANGRSTPGMPFMRTVRRIAVGDISKQQYDDGPPTPPKAAVNP